MKKYIYEISFTGNGTYSIGINEPYMQYGKNNTSIELITIVDGPIRSRNQVIIEIDTTSQRNCVGLDISLWYKFPSYQLGLSC